MSVKYPTYVNLTSSSEEQTNEITLLLLPRKKSLSPPQAPTKSISIKSTHYTSSSAASGSMIPTHIGPPPKLHFVILIKQEPQELPPPFIVEPLRIELPFLEDQFQEDPPLEVLMADNRTIAELLQAPTEGYEDAIVIPEIAANNFELKHDLINLDSLNSATGGNYLDKMPRECLKITESKSKVRQSRAKAVVAKVGTSSSTPAVSSEVAELKDLVRALLLDKKNQSSAPVSSSTHALVKSVEPSCVTCGGSGTLPSNTIANPKEELKGITTQTGVAYQGPKIPTPSKVVKQGTEVTKDQVQTSSSQSNAPVQPLVAQYEIPTLISEPVVASVSALMPNVKSSIPYPSRRIDECLALADLSASINLMPFSVWEALSLPEHTPTCMTLELADRSVSKPIGIAKDVSFKTDQALIDVHKGELTLHIRNEAITYNLDQTVSGNPTPHDDLIVSTTSPTLTLFGDSDFLLFKQADAFPGLEDDPDSPKINPFYYDPEGDILLLETILNSKQLSPLLNHELYLPSFKKELKVCEVNTVKSSVDEPLEVELKDLPLYLEYAFLDGDNKLPVIIAKELGDKEKSALIKVLKSHKRAIAWKLSDIHGINPEFCTHKILMEEDYKPVVQHQRRVNPKIHDVIKKEVEKILDAGLIYPISDSPWVSPDYPDCEVFHALSFSFIRASHPQLHFGNSKTDAQETDKNQAKNDKTKHKVEKIGKDSHSKPKVKRQSP
nr:hypothetical protein [Tanacetum cinerariifolium]